MPDIEFPMEELEKVNDFLAKPSAEGEAAFETSVNKINESLKSQESGIRLSIDNAKVSFYRGPTEEIKFGPEKKSYGDYVQEKFKDIETGENSKGELLSRAQIDQMSSTMGSDIAKGLYGDKVSEKIISAFDIQVKVETAPKIEKFELINGFYGDYNKVEFPQKIIEEAISPQNRAGPNGEPGPAAKAVAEQVIATSKSESVLKGKTPEEIQKATDKVFDKKLAEAKSEWEKQNVEKDRTTFKDVLKYGLVGLAGLFTYEMIAAHAAARSGCFVTTTDTKTAETTSCKLPLLTCDQTAAAAGTLCSFSVDKDWCAPPPSGGTLFPEGCPPCSDGIGQACDKCSGGKDSPCSKYCNNTYMIKSANGKKYDYTCVNCDMKCALNDLGNKANDILNDIANTFQSLWKFLGDIFKYGIYFIIGFIVLYCLYWLITKFTGGKDDKKEKVTIEVSDSGRAAVPSAPRLVQSSSLPVGTGQVPPPISVPSPIRQNLSTPVSSFFNLSFGRSR